MTTYYFDSSALVKRYAQEVGTGWVIALTDPQAGHEIFTALISGAEIVAAIARRTHTDLISPPDARAAIAAFRNHLKTQYRVVLTTAVIVDQAMDLAERHGLRGYDAIQLASALAVQAELIASGASPLVFVSADVDLNKTAQMEGLVVENPNDHP